MARAMTSGHRQIRGIVWIALVFGTVLAATRATNLGDTATYANDIADHLGGSLVGRGNSLWEFGHLLWRPLGWVLATGLSPLFSAYTDWTGPMQANFVLISLGMLSGIITAVLWYLLVVDLSGSTRLAFLVTIGFAFSHGFLLYAHSGCAYIPGLACVSASLYALRHGRVGTGAIFYALGTLLWFPYVLVGGVLLLISAGPGDWKAPVRQSLTALDLRKAVRFVAIAGFCIGLAYGMALGARHISTVQEARQWFVESQHDWTQSIRVLRIATGLPRSFLYMGRDGVLYRRFLFHDPYAPVSILDLIQASLWKIAAFGLFVLGLLYELVRRTDAGWSKLVLTVAAVPVLVFAVILFEPGSPERYLPALPFLLLVTAWLLRDFKAGAHPAQWIIVAFLICVVANNGYAFFRPRVSQEDANSLRRIASFRSQLPKASMIAIATNQDLLMEVASRSPLGAINRPSPIPLFDVLLLPNPNPKFWRERFAASVLRAWDQGGEVWVSKRLWQATPLPEWYWVEGEDPVISWPDVSRFFAQLQTDLDRGGSDGFMRLARNEIPLKHFAVPGKNQE